MTKSMKFTPFVFISLFAILSLIAVASLADLASWPKNENLSPLRSSETLIGPQTSPAGAFSKARYNIAQVGEKLVASNHSNNLKAEFNESGFKLESSSNAGKWKSDWSLKSFGFGDEQIEVKKGELISAEQRVEIKREDQKLVEWFENRPDGLEHGFTLGERPDTKLRKSENLRLVMEIGGNLTAKADKDGQNLTLNDRTGKKVLRYKKLKVWDADKKELIARMEVLDSRVYFEVEEAGARYPLTIDPTIVETKKLTAGDGAAGDHFGYSVSISGDTAVVGAFSDDDNGTDSGSAYILERNEGGADNWGQVAKLTASDGTAIDLFGYAASISGDTVIVSAVADDDNGINSGSAYIFERNAGGANNWGEVSKLIASDGAGGDNFGYSASISGDTVIVSAYLDDGGRGSAYIFERNEGGTDNWGEVTKLIASDGVGADQFGFSASISGDAAVVGAWLDHNGNGSDAGSAYIFERNEGGANNWGETVQLTNSDGAFDDRFGTSVSISGDRIVSGAYRDDPFGSESGSAYIFERNEGGANIWGEVTKLIPSDGGAGDQFGSAVSLLGDTVLIGARRDDNKGSAYIYNKNEGGANNWGEASKLIASDGIPGFGNAGPNFGLSVTLSSDTAIVGSFTNDEIGTDAGAAYIFPSSTTIDQTITFGVLADKSFGGAPFDVSATASSGLTVSFAASGDCTISGVTVSITGVGSCTVTASQSGDSTYNAAPDVDQSFTINPANQTITFGGLSDTTYGGGTFDVSATSSSGLTVSFSAVGFCSISGVTVTLDGAGLCTVTASQAGDDDYNAASDVSQSFATNKASLTTTPNDQTITFGDLDPTYTFSYSAFVNSENSGVLDAEPVCEVVGTHTDAGDYPITCSGGADNNYSFSYGAATLTIEQADQTISFGALAVKTFGDAPFDVSATVTSNLSASFAAAGDCTISGVTVSITGAGSCTITASQSGDGNYNAASDVDQSFTINKADQTITFDSLAVKTFGDAPFNLSATSTTGLAVSFAASGDCSIVGSTVTINGAGSCTITASQAGDSNYNPAPDVDQSFMISKAVLDVTPDNQQIIVGSPDPAFTFSYSGFVNGENSGVIDTAPTCEVSGAHSGIGSYTITCSGGADNNYNFDYGTATLMVQYNFNGFFNPIDNLDTNLVKAGQGIPVKFSLNGDFGLIIMALGYPVSYETPCDGSGDDGDEIPTVTAGNSSLSYSSGSDQYNYVWKTEKSWDGTCRILVVMLNDGSIHTANFKFK